MKEIFVNLKTDLTDIFEGDKPEIYSNQLTRIFELWEHADTLHPFTCKEECHHCCKVESIGMSVLELSIYQKIAEADNKGFGCPYFNKNNCSIYEYRPIVCRTYGPTFKNLSMIGSVNIQKEVLDEFVNKFYPEMFDPKIMQELEAYKMINHGRCLKTKPQFIANEFDANMLYTNYKSLVEETGLIKVGTNTNPKVNEFERYLGMFVAKKFGFEYSLYSPDGLFHTF